MEADASNIAHKLVINLYLSFFLTVHNPLFAYLDFVNQPEKRFPVKAFQIAILPDKAYPFPRRVPVLARSPQLQAIVTRSRPLDKMSRGRLLAVLPQPEYSFSDGHSVFKVPYTDELL